MLAVLFVFSLSACASDGGSEASSDKTPEALNFSAASAADAGVYGLTQEDPGEEDPGGEGTPGDEYTSFGPVQDTTGAISMEVPTEWSDVIGDVSAESPFQAGLSVSPDLEGYSSTWDYPGAFLGVSKSLGADVAASELPEVKLSEVFAALSPRDALKKDCDPTVQSAVIKPGEQNVFAATLGDLLEFGNVDLYSNCGGQGGAFLDLAGLSKDKTSVLYMQVGLVREADIGATLRMVETLAIDFTKVPEPATEQEEDELLVP